ncbi:hypothetical protein McanCB56680_005551, partial [Microsporum canis]
YEPGYRPLNRKNDRFEYSDTPTIELKTPRVHQTTQESRIQDINPDVTTILLLSTDQLEMLRYLKDEHKEQQTRYQTEQNAMSSLRIHLMTTVAHPVFSSEQRD